MKMQDLIEAELLESARVVGLAARLLKHDLDKLASRILECLNAGGKLVLLGNGGSAADAMHIAAEFVVRFRRERQALPAMALTCDGAVLTAIGNDYSFDEVFARQVSAVAQRNDMVIAFSTSGRSRNVLQALRAARAMGITTVALTGNNANDCASLADMLIEVPAMATARIQEVHMAIAHAVCEAVDTVLLQEQSRVENGILPMPCSGRV